MCLMTQMKIFIFVSRHSLSMPPRNSSARKTRSQDAKASPSTPSTIKIKVPAPGSTRRPSTPAPSPVAQRQSTPALPRLSSLPKFSELDYKKPFHKPSPESFAWPANLVLNSLAYHEYGSFKMDKTTAKSFYVLMHPAIGHLVPLIRRPAHVEAQTPAVLRELLTKALPVFVRVYNFCLKERSLIYFFRNSSFNTSKGSTGHSY